MLKVGKGYEGTVRLGFDYKDTWYVAEDLAKKYGILNGVASIKFELDEDDYREEVVFDLDSETEEKVMLVNSAGRYWLELMHDKSGELKKHFKYEVLPAVYYSGYYIPKDVRDLFGEDAKGLIEYLDYLAGNI